MSVGAAKCRDFVVKICFHHFIDASDSEDRMRIIRDPLKIIASDSRLDDIQSSFAFITILQFFFHLCSSQPSDLLFLCYRSHEVYDETHWVY